jgi:BlaI family penicillinase repressor
MSKATQLTDAEWELLKVLWASPGLTANEVADSLATAKWHVNTVRTMLDRLEKKGVVDAVAADRSYRYSPLVTREECIDDASSSFLEKVFDGAFTPLVSHFVKQSPISQKDKAELERILKKYQSKEK